MSGTAIDDALDTERTEPFGLEAELDEALERREFRVFYQPMLSVETRRLLGFEALVRWEHPERGLLAPDSFLAEAERTGRILPLGRWVLREACRCTRAWQERFPQDPPLVVSVNLSPKQFEQADLVDQVLAALDETGLAPESLKLEITETLVMKDPGAAREMLLQLRALNVRLGIDDFGTGYSSLSYLREFPVHTLKIDRSFVRNIDRQKENLEIVRAIITLARNVGLDVIAEGVETAAQAALLRILHCDHLQGYLIAKPLPEEQAAALIAKVNDGHFEPLLPAADSGREPALAAPAPVLVEQVPVPVRRGKWIALVAALLAIAAFAYAMLPSRAPQTLRLAEPAHVTAPLPGEEAAPAPREPEPRLLQEIEQAIAAERFDNALLLCGRVLLAFPGHAPTQQLRQKAARLAIAQAEGKIREGKFDEARTLYTALRDRLGNDPLAADAKQALRRLEVVSYPVVHDHFLASCSGTLSFNAYTIAFVPQEGTKHAFSEPVSAAAAHLEGKFMKLTVGDKTFRFKTAAGSKEIAAVFEELQRRSAK